MMEFYVRHAPGRQVAQEIRTVMAQVESNVPIVMLQTFDDAVSLGLLPQKLAAWIAGSVGTIGVFLAALGLYGLMAFLVAQRTKEIAIRMALGASHRDMRAMVLKQAATLGAIGGVIGLLPVIGTLGQRYWSAPPIDPRHWRHRAAVPDRAGDRGVDAGEPRRSYGSGRAARSSQCSAVGSQSLSYCAHRFRFDRNLLLVASFRHSSWSFTRRIGKNARYLRRTIAIP